MTQIRHLTSRTFSTIICWSVACFMYTTEANAGGAGGGPSFSLGSGGGLTSKERERLRQEIEAGMREIAKINQSNKQLDKIIAIAHGVDFLLGQVASTVPHGGAVYNAGKSVGYLLSGEKKEAGKAAVSAFFSEAFFAGAQVEKALGVGSAITGTSAAIDIISFALVVDENIAAQAQ